MSYENLVDSVTQTLDAAPELAQSPELAVPVAQQVGDVQTNARAVAQTANQQARSDAKDAVAKQAGSHSILHKAFGFLHAGWNAVGNIDPVRVAIGNAAHLVSNPMEEVQSAVDTLNKPLQEVHHEYKYLRDVEAQHGPIAATIEGLGIAAATAAGTYAGGAKGGVLGAEAGAWIEGHGLYKDSWDRTANPNYVDPSTGKPVNPGEDVANLISKVPGLGSGRLHTAAADLTGFISDMALDPVARVGGIVGEARSPEGASGLLGNRFGGTAPQGATLAERASDVDRIARQYPSVRRAFQDIADSSSGDIAAHYAKYFEGDPGLMARLGAASTADQVQQVITEAVRAKELSSADMGRLPSLTWTRELARNAAEGIQNADLPVVSKAAQRLNRVPAAFDEELNKFSRKEFDPTNDRGANGIYRMVLFAETPDVAKDVVSQYLEAPVAQRVTIYRNAVYNTLAKMAADHGWEGDPGAVGEYADSLVRNWLPSADGGVYAVDQTGRNVSTVIDDTGRHLSAGLLDNHVGNLSYPDFTAMKRAAAEASGARDWLGKVDDFAYNNITQPIFKRWVLQSLGYPLRIAMAEDIPNSLRLGFNNMVKDRLAASIGKLGQRVSDDEAGAVGRYVWNMLGTTGVRDADRVDFAVNMAHDLDGHIVTPGVSTEHNIAAEVSTPPGEVARRSLRSAVTRVPPRELATRDFALFGPGDARFSQHWQSWLKEIAEDPKSQVAADSYLSAMRAGASETEASAQAIAATKAWLDQQPESYLNKYIRHFYNSQGPGLADNHEDWARVIVENLKGATTGADGTVHVPLISAIAQGAQPASIEVGGFVRAGDRGNVGRVLSMDENGALVHFINKSEGSQARVRLPLDSLTSTSGGRGAGEISAADLSNIDEAARPMLVKGRQYLPDPDSKLERVANFGFRKVMNPVVNFLSREPVFMEEAYRQYQPLAQLVEDGTMTAEEARSLAYSKATEKMIGFVHNLNERSQFAETARNWAPFYFAQEQAYKRVGRLLAENPGAFRKYQIMLTGMHDFGQRVVDGNGNNQMVLPGTGWLGSGVPAIAKMVGLDVVGSSPATFTGNLSSASTVFPLSEGVRPNLGPVVAVPIKAVANLFPELQRVEPAVLGDVQAGEPIWKQLVPNATVQRVIEASQTNSRGFHSAMMQTLQLLDFKQEQAMRGWQADPAVKAEMAKDPNRPLSQIAQAAGRPLPDYVPPPDADARTKQKFVNTVRNQTRILYFTKALIGAVSPLAPSLHVEDYGLPNELRQEISKTGSLNQGTQEFLLKHPEATPWTTYQSNTNTGQLPATADAQNWVDDHFGIVDQYPLAATYLMPPVDTTKYDPGVYNEQLAQGLRTKKTPLEFLDDLYIAAANHRYYDQAKPYHDTMIVKAAHPDWPDTQVRAYVAAGIPLQDMRQMRLSIDPTELDKQWSAFRQTMEKQNPVWGDWMNSTQRDTRRQQAVAQLQELFASGKAPQGAQTDAVRGLVHDYAKFHAAYVTGHDSGWASYSNNDLKDAWQSYLTRKAKASPNLAPLINNVFMEITQ